MAKEQPQALRYALLASAHAGEDFVLWLRYLCKWVTPTGHIFTQEEAAAIMAEERIRPLHRTMFAEAITPGTPTNQYVIWLNSPVDTSAVMERIRSYGED